jgi:hypothetical protein
MAHKQIVTPVPWIVVEDFNLRAGWDPSEGSDARSRAYCERLEAGEILFFRELPFNLPVEDREFLLVQKWSELRLHKNVSYRPETDILRGVSGDRAATDRLHTIFRNYSAQVIEFLENFLAPYSGSGFWISRASVPSRRKIVICRCTSATIFCMWTHFPRARHAAAASCASSRI